MHARQRSLVRSAFFPSALISEEFSLAAQRVRRMQHGGTLSLSCSVTLQLVFLEKHANVDDILILVSFRSVGLLDVIYLVSASHFTSIPCEHMNQAPVSVVLASFRKAFFKAFTHLLTRIRPVVSLVMSLKKIRNNDVIFKINMFLKYIYLAIYYHLSMLWFKQVMLVDLLSLHY